MTTLLEEIKNRVLLNDGAMGTQLQEAGLEPGGCGELWNLTHPEKIITIHKAYVQAGADCLTTNTFGGSRIMLERHVGDAPVREVNRSAVRLARQAFTDLGKKGFVIGDIGPFGGLMEPYGEYSEETVRASMREQADALMEESPDAIIIETQTVLEELAIGVEEAKKAGCPCVIASLAFDLTNETRELRTMMGTDPKEAALFVNSIGADILALNCGAGVDMLQACEAVKVFRENSRLPIMVQPNAGTPVLVGIRAVYRQTPEDMARDACFVLEQGINILGSCCGSTPRHTQALRNLLDQR